MVYEIGTPGFSLSKFAPLTRKVRIFSNWSLPVTALMASSALPPRPNAFTVDSLMVFFHDADAATLPLIDGPLYEPFTAASRSSDDDADSKRM